MRLTLLDALFLVIEYHFQDEPPPNKRMNSDAKRLAPFHAGYARHWAALLRLRAKKEERNEQANQRENDISPYCGHLGDRALFHL